MVKTHHAALLAAFLAAVLIGNGQEVRTTVLRPLAFLTGRWVSQERTEVQEENWSQVIGNSMAGSFRIVQSGRPVFYEFWVVEVDHNRPVLKLKHFNANLTGWEEKNASTKMPLISKAEGDAAFAEEDGSVSLHYHRIGDILSCTVHHLRNGKSSDETFTLTRVSGILGDSSWEVNNLEHLIKRKCDNNATDPRTQGESSPVSFTCFSAPLWSAQSMLPVS